MHYTGEFYHYVAKRIIIDNMVNEGSGLVVDTVGWNTENDFDDWGSLAYLNETANSDMFYQELSLGSNSAPNASIYTLADWNVTFSNGRNYTPPAGILGLGPSYDNPNSSILGQCKASGDIASKFGGFHMSSGALNQPGSMVLGGWDENRIVGDVGVFNLLISSPAPGPNAQDIYLPGGPQAFLLDVILDVETGGSPFNQTNSISLWYGIDDEIGDTSSVAAGGKTGSRLVTINPSIPYLYLPNGLCETASQYLPVTFNESLQLYVWNTDDHQYTRIIQSPAFMAIVLADSFANNTTVKISFRLLNLTLVPPLVDHPMHYFPCKPFSISQDFALGRTFLQAAFLGFEYEHNLAYIAQAPGPDMEQSVT